MSIMTIDDLRAILTECAGEDDAVEAADDIADTPFEELGYDSLALIETAARIEQRYGVRIPDGDIMDLPTPRAVLDAVNAGGTGSDPSDE
jgi:minimal PKS acyl carrier protein